MAKILVADDNSNIQKMVVLALKDQGIDVVAVGNGEAAVRKISDIHPDLVLADVFMPVRNGYEVCRYVKEDTKLSHIPVILLVGAFDPLDEQEAQRVAADGVLKKPFVPPDPLISMVKSALTRAGVSLGPAPPEEKPAPAPSRPITELFRAATPKPAAPAEAVPDATPEPVEEFTVPQPKVTFNQGQEPVAFGSLLDTAETDEAAATTAKPMIDLAADRKWEEEPDEVHEEEDEESSSNGWRATGLDEQIERAAAPSTSGTKDWRVEAFAESAATDVHATPSWTPAAETPAMVEAAEVPSVAVSTLDSTAAPAKDPFAGDDWAAAMAAGVEQKLSEASEIASVAPQIAEETESAVKNVHEAESAAPRETPAAEPANWAVVPESSWELEAKRASMLASTWDAPAEVPVPDVNETQDVSSYAAHAPELHEEHLAEHGVESISAYSGAPTTHEEAAHAAEEHFGSEPAAVLEHAEHEALETEPVNLPAASLAEVTGTHTETATVEEHLTEPPASSAVATPQAPPDMDELVKRVLQKMSPEVISRVTQEILKPVIEAIVRNELDSKK